MSKNAKVPESPAILLETLASKSVDFCFSFFSSFSSFRYSVLMFSMEIFSFDSTKNGKKYLK